MDNPIISKLRIYPIKSLGHIDVKEVEIGVHSLMNDRVFAMIDQEGRYINGKRTPRVNQLKTEYDLANGVVAFSEKTTNHKTTFELRERNAALDEYLSDFFNTELKLVKNTQGQFMDIPVESSITIVSEASLQYLQKDIESHSLENMRLRFRSNIEITGVEAFWEEQLYHQPGIGVRFRIGEVEMLGMGPRARCNVPPQHPDTGEMDYQFVKNMIRSRKNHSPTAEQLLQYGKAHYFLCINVYSPKTEVGKKIRLNDGLEVIEPVTIR